MDAVPKISHTVVYILKSYDVLFWLQWDYRQNFLSPFLFLFHFLDLNWANVQAKRLQSVILTTTMRKAMLKICAFYTTNCWRYNFHAVNFEGKTFGFKSIKPNEICVSEYGIGVAYTTFCTQNHSDVVSSAPYFVTFITLDNKSGILNANNTNIVKVLPSTHSCKYNSKMYSQQEQ